jgi:catechol 2,3-dioxygenase-like lactoylglutathione lyase family enzyme/predicted enzyme related to lactoylglutathione lyase
MNPLIAGMRGVEIGANDVRLVNRFYEDVWTLRPIASAGGLTQFAGAGAAHPILTVVGGGAAVRRMIWNARSMAALEELHGRIRAAGLAVSASHRAFDDGFGIGFDSRDPEGRTVSFVALDGAAASPPVRDRITKVTHLNLNCGAYDVMRAHMAGALGFRVVDETKTNGFFNCDVDHHALVIGRSPMPPTLNHIAFEMPDLDSMMRMCGTMRENGYPIEWGVGRHGPGDNVFAYFAGPEDMPIECTAEVLQIGGDYAYRGPDAWGFPPGRTDQWGVTDAPSPRIKRIQRRFPFIELPLR